MSDKAKYAYLAGILDGEGCLSIGAGRRQKWGVINYNSVVSVANTDIRLIKWLHSNFGGCFFEGKQQRPNNKKHYIWRMLKRKQIELLLLAVLPYLVVKREQAVNLLEFVRLPRDMNPEKRQEFWERQAVLNKRGIGVTTNTQDNPENGLKIESGLTGDRESAPVVMQGSDTCEVPPLGWWCSREKGHSGPCAARPLFDLA